MRKWNKGFPPFTGWWNVVLDKYKENGVGSWFDAEKQTWGQFCFEYQCQKEVARLAVIPITLTQLHSFQIEWTDYWPENAHVPRIDPRKTK